MADILIRKDGTLGHITLNRPKALNALTYEMALAIEDALDGWRDDASVALLLIDALGERAFCSGGDISELYASGKRGDFGYGQRFWRDEYRMNAKLAEYPKPVVSLMQGFTMGGGVGIGCHGSHRVVGESSGIAMPECSIGLVPDVGGSLILANAPGHLGEYLATTAARIGPDDAIYTGFADYYIPQLKWPELTARLVDTGETAAIGALAEPPTGGRLKALRPMIEHHFTGRTLADITRTLSHSSNELARDALKIIRQNSPLSMACAVEMIHRLRGSHSIHRALEQEYRFTSRAMEKGDFLEGIRAQIIDRDHTPHWRHQGAAAVTVREVEDMLRPRDEEKLNLKEKQG